MVINNEQSYLGMQIKIGEGKISLDMRHYLDKLLSEHDNLQVMVGPGTADGFAVDPTSALLEEDRKANSTQVWLNCCICPSGEDQM
jgi:hypothetical protein